jgi:hypothetical protein
VATLRQICRNSGWDSSSLAQALAEVWRVAVGESDDDLVRHQRVAEEVVPDEEDDSWGLGKRLRPECGRKRRLRGQNLVDGRVVRVAHECEVGVNLVGTAPCECEDCLDLR